MRRRPAATRARRQRRHRRIVILSSDPIATGVQVLAAAIVLGLLFVLPGLAWGPVIAPGTGSPIVTVGRAAGASLLVGAPACTLLAALGVLTPPAVVVTLVGLTLVPFLVPSRRRAARRGVAALRHGAGGRRRVVALAVGVAGAVVAVAIVVVPSRQAVGDSLLPFSSTVWYYANLARETALQGGFPASLPEWGTLRPFQTDYLPVTAHTAAAFALLPDMDIRLLLEAYRLALLGAALAVATLLFRRFVSTWLAVLGACLLLATVRLDGRFVAYRPETWALVVALYTLWLADRAMTERSPRLAVAAVAGAAVTEMAHAEAFLLLGPAVVGLAVARLLVAGGRRGLAFPSRRTAGPVLGIALLVFAGGMAVGSAALFGLTGELRVLGYVAGHRTAERPPLPPADEIPPGWTFSDDPTWDFYVASVAPASMGTAPPDRFFDSRMLPRSIVWIWPGLDGRTPEGLVVLAALVAAPLLAWPWLDRRRRRQVVLMVVFGAALFVGSYLLFAISSTYVPMRTGPRRLMPYELLVPVLAALTVLWAAGRALQPGWRALLGPRGRSAVAAALAGAVIVAAAVAPVPGGTADSDPEPGLTQAGYDAYAWMDANLPPDARILANAYSDGSVAALAQRVGIVDGRAVYLENPEFLAESTALVLGARSLFLDPAGDEARRFLAENAVDYVLVANADAGGTGADLGAYDPFVTDVAALRAADGYTLVRSFAGGRMLLFAVDAPAATADAAVPSR